MGNVADALGPLVPNVRTPKRSDVQTPTRSDGRPRHLSEAQRKRIADAMKRRFEQRRSDAQTPRRLDVATPERPAKKLAKSQDPRYAKKTLYLVETELDDAIRRYKAETGDKEESELVGRLVREYVAGGFRG